MGFFGPPNIEKMEAKGDVEGLIKALKDKDKVVRKEATIALGRVKDTRAVEPLIEAMKDKDYHVQRQAAQALGKIGDARALEPLIKTLEDYFVREKAAEALVEILDAGAVEALIQCVDAGVAKALRDMKEMKDKREVDLLIKTLGDEDEDIRQKTVEALGNIGDARAVEPLIKALGDEEEDVRNQAASFVAKSKYSKARLFAEYIEINWYGIGETDIDRGIGLLHQLSKDSNPWITDYVIYELRKFMGDRSRYLYLNHTLDVAKELINRAEDRFLGFLVRYFRESKRKLEGTPEFAEFKILYENKDVYEKWRTQISTDELISMYAHADSSGDILVDLLKNPSLKSIKFIEREISKWESWPSSLFELVEEMLKSQDERFSNALTKFIQMAEKWASHVTPGFEDWEDWELKRAKHEEVDDIDQLNKRIITYFQQASKG